MINIEQGQKVAENDNLRVLSPSGSYEDNDLIEFCDENTPGQSLGAFAAQYIKYGGLVYKFDDAEELGRELLKLDPESTHTTASLIRMQDELKKKFDHGDLEPASLNQALDTEQNKLQDQVNNPPTNDTPVDTSTTTPAVLDSSVGNENADMTVVEPILDNTTSTTTSYTTINLDDGTSTSTPIIETLPTDPVVIPVEDNTATSTEPLSLAGKLIKRTVKKSIKNKFLS